MLCPDSVLSRISLLVSVIGSVCIQRVIKKSNSIDVIRKLYCSQVHLIIKLKLVLIIHIKKKNAKVELLFRFYHICHVIRIETIYQSMNIYVIFITLI